LSEGRRIAIPAEACHKIGLSQGDPVTIEVREDGLHLVPYDQLIRDVQGAFSGYKRPGISEVDELIRERREETGRDDER
jgi:AbrB family looped-hinge helix DNA binding protein